MRSLSKPHFFTHSLNKKSGNVIAGLMSLIGVAGLTMILSQIEAFKIKSTYEQVVTAKNLVNIQNAIEVFLVAYRTNQTLYYSAIHQANQLNPILCSTPRSFVEAFEKGHDCGNFQIVLFDSSILASDDPYTEKTSTGNFYTYSSGCLINNEDSTCPRTIENKLIMTIGYDNPAQKIGGVKYQFFLVGFFPEKGVGEFRVEAITDGSNKKQIRNFAITTDIRDLAHIEFDTRIVRDSVDPMNPCPNDLWGEFNFLDMVTKQCRTFGYLGAGTGLAYYKNRFFIFRSMDGGVVDIGAAGAVPVGFENVSTVGLVGSGEVVNENGFLPSGVKVFPPYSQSALLGVRDIDVVGNQVFYIEGQGPGANLGYIYLNGTTGQWQRETVCPLGALGWSQTYKGIAASSWSDEILRPQLMPGPMGGPIGLPILVEGGSSSSNRPRLASFSLKTSSGDILIALVVQHPNKGGVKCVVHKNEIASQDIEHKRTNGISRVWDKVPYWIY